MWCGVLDVVVVNHAEFHQNRFRVFFLPDWSKSAIFLCLTLWLIYQVRATAQPVIIIVTSREYAVVVFSVASVCL